MKSICVDFDGVIHSYTSSWTTAEDIPDPPVSGAIEWLEEMTNKFKVYIFSCRCETLSGWLAIDKWLRLYGLSDLALNKIEYRSEKPKAVLYIDDRAWRFTGPGTMPTLEQIENFKPWNR